MTIHEIITHKTKLPVHFDIYNTNNHLVPSHWHAHLEVIYLLDGTMLIVRNDEKYTLQKHDLFIVNSSDIHYTRSIGSAKILLLQIPYDILDQSITQYNTLHFKEYFTDDEINEIPNYKKMIDHLLTMAKLYEEGLDGYPFLFSSNLYQFLHILYTNCSNQQNPTEINNDFRHLERLREVIAYVEQHYREPISLKEAASLVALNTEYFCRIFKKYMGLSFLEYVNQVRLTHIHKDIVETTNSISEIQERHGFSNYKVFNRMFKEIYGCNPSKIRKSS